ncbi:metallophosphoesterase [Thioclava dalianensis]|uniref:Metallophosphoesterase n=1 Tax=Thioclava dalianensis TaxID=1185766 RepID=A0A074TK65_9RHOB|nr:ligase-associated DNA damage response endonuclease PdeM [Thioclava dalianensis]KEP69373.1 metallophosphoesterase [Thioclava dalianensis]SFN03809.1 putative phosphoesterase [Thioclava dalianensis]
MTPIQFAGALFHAQPSGALYWPAQDMLIVADLHLGKSGRIARRGGALLPPFESLDTLHRLEAEVARLAPARLISLGDAFDDDTAARELPPEVAERLAALAGRLELIWIAGNHDPQGLGQSCEALPIGPVTLRHIAEAEGPDISGHYHPKARLARRARPAFAVGQTHLILPAFGTYTGGLDCDGPELRALIGLGRAVLTGTPMLTRPLGYSAARQSR